jgi:hypothetical protein
VRGIFAVVFFYKTPHALRSLKLAQHPLPQGERDKQIGSRIDRTRHREEFNDEAIQSSIYELDCFVALAMTK